MSRRSRFEVRARSWRLGGGVGLLLVVSAVGLLLMAPLSAASFPRVSAARVPPYEGTGTNIPSTAGTGCSTYPAKTSAKFDSATGNVVGDWKVASDACASGPANGAGESNVMDFEFKNFSKLSGKAQIVFNWTLSFISSLKVDGSRCNNSDSYAHSEVDIEVGYIDWTVSSTPDVRASWSFVKQVNGVGSDVSPVTQPLPLSWNMTLVKSHIYQLVMQFAGSVVTAVDNVANAPFDCHASASLVPAFRTEVATLNEIEIS